MKRLFISIIVILSIFMLFSCNFSTYENTDKLPMDLDNLASGQDSQKEAEAVGKDAIQNNANADNTEEKRAMYTLKAIVKAVTNEHIEVEIIESDYAFGIYWVLTSSDTEYFNANGSKIGRGNIKIGNTIEIDYSGQTMLSYPPQVVAYTIKLIND